ncbi:peroxisome biogenesis protein 16-like isoform X5 [Malus sylvestris]|uniref:peroxisome biogenesis protein 16-like isoform X5 n=1 Tax=Malus sylvestris TaxID=3752 RepID=UPI0021ACF122|nr:peroxisome biogenesis protein 16-like isoform X5 [Malus sylvestris]
MGKLWGVLWDAMEAYKKWVRENQDFVHSLESLANEFTWLLPGRFSESEIGPEAVTTLLGIITAINEHIINTDPPSVHDGAAEGYSFPYALCISALRLALFRNSGYKMLLHGGETLNDETDLEASTPQCKIGGLTKPGEQLGPGYLRNNNHRQGALNSEGRALSALSGFGENPRMVSEPVWLHRVQQQHASMEPPTPLVERLTLSTLWSEKCFHGAFYVFGEVLFITRPLMYVLFIRKCGIRSWIPWLLSLAMDFTGMRILSRISSSRGGTKAPQFHLSVSEKDEVRRRKLLWALYAMRDPFYTRFISSQEESKSGTKTSSFFSNKYSFFSQRL